LLLPLCHLGPQAVAQVVRRDRRGRDLRERVADEEVPADPREARGLARTFAGLGPRTASARLLAVCVVHQASRLPCVRLDTEVLTNEGHRVTAPPDEVCLSFLEDRFHRQAWPPALRALDQE